MQYTSLNLRRLVKPKPLGVKNLKWENIKDEEETPRPSRPRGSTAALPRKITKVKKGAKWFTGYDGAPGQ